MLKRTGAVGATSVARALQANLSLTHLDLYGNRITSEASKIIGRMLSQNKTLKRVVLGGQNFQRLEAIKPIADALQFNVGITELDLRSSGITSEGASTF
jgi:Ran GTPase-activating protein (RanGAP) involved in mRNA processing and transport